MTNTFSKTIMTVLGANDYIFPVESDLFRDAKDSYSYTGEIMVAESFKEFADAVYLEYELCYPPVTHEDALYMYFIITDECKDLSS